MSYETLKNAALSKYGSQDSIPNDVYSALRKYKTQGQDTLNSSEFSLLYGLSTPSSSSTAGQGYRYSSPDQYEDLYANARQVGYSGLDDAQKKLFNESFPYSKAAQTMSLKEAQDKTDADAISKSNSFPGMGTVGKILNSIGIAQTSNPIDMDQSNALKAYVKENPGTAASIAASTVLPPLELGAIGTGVASGLSSGIGRVIDKLNLFNNRPSDYSSEPISSNIADIASNAGIAGIAGGMLSGIGKLGQIVGTKLFPWYENALTEAKAGDVDEGLKALMKEVNFPGSSSDFRDAYDAIQKKLGAKYEEAYSQIPMTRPFELTPNGEDFSNIPGVTTTVDNSRQTHYFLNPSETMKLSYGNPEFNQYTVARGAFPSELDDIKKAVEAMYDFDIKNAKHIKVPENKFQSALKSKMKDLEGFYNRQSPLELSEADKDAWANSYANGQLLKYNQSTNGGYGPEIDKQVHDEAYQEGRDLLEKSKDIKDFLQLRNQFSSHYKPTAKEDERPRELLDSYIHKAIQNRGEQIGEYSKYISDNKINQQYASNKAWQPYLDRNLPNPRGWARELPGFLNNYVGPTSVYKLSHGIGTWAPLMGVGGVGLAKSNSKK